MKLLENEDVLKWIRGDLSFLSERTKECENAWGRSLMNKQQQWTGPFGEQLCQELYSLREKHPVNPMNKEGFEPDWETDDYIIEAKTQTYLTTGTAGEKILGVPFKYADVPRLYGKPLKIVCIGRAEQLSREHYGNLQGGTTTPQKQKFIEFYKENGIEFASFCDEYLVRP